MKTRLGFVSNSSSASFMVPKSRLSYVEGQAILAYNSSEENVDGWDIYEDGDCIRGMTIMDNDALDDYFEKMGIDMRKLEWESF